MNVEIISYGNWSRCYRLSDGRIELIVTAEVGPRIIYAGLVGSRNMLFEKESDLGTKGGTDYRFYGGHRLWHAPEHAQRTYQADNESVDYFELDGVHYFVPSVESATGIQKQLSISMRDNTIIVDHALTNTGMWAVELAAWGVTMMRSGGMAILPLPKDGADYLLPTYAITSWSYTALNDARLRFGDSHIFVKQSPQAQKALKIGVAITPDVLWTVGWLAYLNDGQMFVKSFQPAKENDAVYPDLGSQVEVYTDASLLELESLSPLQSLAPEATITHREYWSLHDKVVTPSTDSEVGLNILPLVREAHPHVGRRQNMD